MRLERAALRDRLIDRLAEENEWDHHRRLSKCGQDLWLLCTSCGQRKCVQTRCDLKWCPSCQHGLAAATAERYARLIHLVKNPILVTHTVTNFPYDCNDAVQQISKAWVKLKALRWWKGKVCGGVTAIEVTDIGNGLHAHLHGLWDCSWYSVTVPKPAFGSDKQTWKRRGKAACTETAAQWSLCAQREGSTHVRRVTSSPGRTVTDAIREVVKYAVKGSDLVNMAARVGPLITMLDRTRAIRPFGTLHGHPDVRRVHPAPKPCECGACGAFQPEAIVLGTAYGTDGLTDRQRKRR